MKYILPLLLVSLLASCASQTRLSNGALTSDQYEDVLEKNSQKIRTYSGFYNTLDVQGSILNSEASEAQLQFSRNLYQWNDEKFQSEKITVETRLGKSADFFVSFFTPDRKNDDLIKASTTWRIFLDVDGRRFEGKVTRVKVPMADLQAMYPYHNRFATAYNFSFPVSMRVIEGNDATVTITGPVGSGQMIFKGLK